MIKHLILLRIRNVMDIKEVFLPWFINILIKNSSGVIKNENMSNEKLAEELQKPNIRKFERRKIHSFL